MTYYRVAQESGIDADYIKRIEESTKENEPNIKIETLERLAKAIGVPASDLISSNENAMSLTAKERTLITAFRCFDEKAQDACLGFMEALRER